MYSIVTGFFPETSPKETWATNPRPLLVCGTAKDETSGTIFCRIAYGTSNLSWQREEDLVIGNLSMLDRLGLKTPTKFVLYSGKQILIMPWTQEFFQPWSTYKSPVLSVLPDDMQRWVGHTLVKLRDLPEF